jgi:hypothetical protein
MRRLELIALRALVVAAVAAPLALAWPSLAESAAIASLPERPDDAPLPTVPLSIAVARDVTDAGVAPVQNDAWIAAQLAEVERLFTPYGLSFATVESRAIAPAQAHAETRRDRDAFAAALHPGVVNVFVVASLRDVDDPSRMRMGVCWSPRGDSVARYVIVSSIARPSVLAHELGHYFGNPHSKVPNNVMSYDRTAGVAPFFDDAQGKVLRRTARALFQRGVLKPPTEPHR